MSGFWATWPVAEVSKKPSSTSPTVFSRVLWQPMQYCWIRALAVGADGGAGFFEAGSSARKLIVRAAMTAAQRQFQTRERPLIGNNTIPAGSGGQSGGSD